MDYNGDLLKRVQQGTDRCLPENILQLYRWPDDESNTEPENARPENFRPGCIVECQLTFCVIRSKNGQLQMKIMLRSMFLLDIERAIVSG